jgi:hypothetical protein
MYARKQPLLLCVTDYPDFKQLAQQNNMKKNSQQSVKHTFLRKKRGLLENLSSVK